jgi:hypothetical protein
MKIITDYYCCTRLPEFSKNKTPRYDCISSSKSYPPFEAIAGRSRVKRFFFYLTDIPERFDPSVRRKTDKSINNGKNITSVFILDIQSFPDLAFGDTKDTTDALLILFSDDRDTVEIFVCRGQKSNRVALCNLLADKELDEEMEFFRKLTVTKSVTMQMEMQGV